MRRSLYKINKDLCLAVEGDRKKEILKVNNGI